MSVLLKWTLGLAGVLVAIAALIYGVGVALPRHHIASVERVIPMSADMAAARLRTVRDYPSWRPGLDLEITAEEPGAISYIETQDGEHIAFRLTETTPGRRFVSTITDPTLPFGGAWTTTIEPRGGVSLVRIEENGEIRDPLYRFFARFVFGCTSTIEGYLDRLEASVNPAPSAPLDR